MSAEELLTAAYTFLSHSVSVDVALEDGFDVQAWCEAVERLLTPRDEIPIDPGQLTIDEALKEAHDGATQMS